MKHKKIFAIYIETESKSDFGIEFMEKVLRATVRGLNGFRKCYKAVIIESKKAKLGYKIEDKKGRMIVRIKGLFLK